MEKNELLKSRKLKTKRIIKKTISDFSKLPKKIKEKRIEQSEPSCWSKFPRGKKWTFILSQFLEWTFMSDQICRMKKNEKKRKKWKKKTFSLFFQFYHSENSFFLVPQKSSFWNFAHVKSSFFFIPEKCSKQKFVFCLSPCFKISSSNTLSQTRPKP